MAGLPFCHVRLLPREPMTFTRHRHHSRVSSVVIQSLSVPKRTWPSWLSKLFSVLPAARSVSSVFLRSYRTHRLWAWPALTPCGPAKSSDCPCSCPAAVQPPGSPLASSPCGQRISEMVKGLDHVTLVCRCQCWA